MTPFLLVCFLLVQAQKPQSIHPLQANASTTTASTIDSFATTASTPHLTYYGGRVLAHVKVFTIFWGGAVRYSAQINAFYKGVTKSAYFDWLSEYNTGTQSIGRGSFIGNYVYSDGATGTITDASIQAALKNLVATGAVTAPDLNTLYAIHFAPGINIIQGGDQSCVKFCAYHGTIRYTTPAFLYYSVVPDQGGGCAGGCGNDPEPFNNLCSVSSHELIESVTDAGVGVATRTAPPLAWYDTTNGEIADICGSQQGKIVGGNGQTYTVQKVWSNKYKSCINKAPAAGAATTPPTTGGTCSHNKCVTGGPLVSTCDSCVQAVCAYDDWCCSTSWDSTCVGEIGLYCGSSCSAAPVGNAPTTCTHSHCSVGEKLNADCDPCVEQICKKDSLCCNNKWDSICVTEVKTYCNITCDNTAPITQSDVLGRRRKTGVFSTFENVSPHGLLPSRTDTTPPSGHPRNVIVTCAGNGTDCLNQTTADLNGTAFGFAPSSSTAPQVSLFQVPANAKIHIGIHPPPRIPVYLYVYHWPKGEYTFMKGKYEIQTSTTTSETTDHSIEVVSNEEPFSGILEFSAGTREIQWKAEETLDNTYLRFTLAYVAPASP